MKKTMQTLKIYMQNAKILLIFAGFSVLLSNAAKFLIPFLAGKTINLIIAHDTKQIKYYIVGMLICLIIGLVFRYLFEYLINLASAKTIKNMRDKLFEKYINLPVSYFGDKQTGDLVSRLIQDSENIQNGLILGLASLLDGVLSILLIVGFMIAINWALSLIVVFLTPISIIVGKTISKKNSRYFRTQAKDHALLASFTQESLNNSNDIQSSNLVDYKKKQFKEMNEKVRHSLFHANMAASSINPTTRLINYFINAVVVLVGACFLIFDTKLGIIFAVGDLLSFITYANNYTQPFNEISNVITDINYAVASLKRIDQVNNIEIVDNQKFMDYHSPIENIELRNIDFKYPNNQKQIINDFNLTIKKGERIALVGETGCGKTTIINLLMKFYNPNKGSIRINDVNLMDISTTKFYKEVGMVLQDTWILNGTVLENIKYGKEDATREEVIAAAKKANADEFISRLENGYDTYINNSSALSLGERQLICIARVMLRNPEILILDEATSNIDIRLEKLLNESFYKLLEGKTSLVIAHRLNTIINSDHIVVMKDGHIEEIGTHQQLMKKKGYYHHLFTAQYN